MCSVHQGGVSIEDTDVADSPNWRRQEAWTNPDFWNMIAHPTSNAQQRITQPKLPRANLRHNGIRIRSEWRYVFIYPFSVHPYRLPTLPGGRFGAELPESLTRSLIVGTSRCFPFWQELLGCYVINAAEGEASKKKCIPALEDYYECLHHRKEVCDTTTRDEALSHA